MTWFRCFVHGENFPGQLIGEAGPVGFYVTRFVEAADAGDAEAAALRALRAEPRLAPPPGWTPAGLAKVYFQEIEEVAADRVAAVPPGFTWYRMEGAAAEPGGAADRAGGSGLHGA